MVDEGTYILHLLGAESHQREAAANVGGARSRFTGLGAFSGWSRIRSGKWYGLLLVAATAMFMLLAGLCFWLCPMQQEVWQNPDFPTVSSEVRATGVAASAADIEEELRRDALQAALLEYPGIRLLEVADPTADYLVRLEVERSGNALLDEFSLVERRSGRLLWIKRYPTAGEQDIDRNVSSAVLHIVGVAGEITSAERRRNNSVRSPNGCWLAFTQASQQFATASDEDLADCAKDWYDASYDHPMAAFLYGWTLIDQSTTVLIASSREARLEEALTVINRALVTHPDYAMLHVVQARAYAFSGECELVVGAVNDAMANAPHNRTIAGASATLLVLCNHAGGEEILATLRDDQDLAMPWEHFGRAVAAMMRDDVEGMGHHVARLERYLAGGKVLNLLKAAQAGRANRPREARSAIEALYDDPRVQVMGISGIVERLPFAPAVKRRLSGWIEMGEVWEAD